MYISETTIRVRYGETDKMGHVYHGNYTQYYDVARVEALRQLGYSYKKMEEDGTLLPVYTCSLKFLKPAFYDDLLTIKTVIKEMPRVKVIFEYEIFNQQNELLNIGATTLVFVDVKTNKPCMVPLFLMEKIKPYF